MCVGRRSGARAGRWLRRLDGSGHRLRYLRLLVCVGADAGKLLGRLRVFVNAPRGARCRRLHCGDEAAMNDSGVQPTRTRRPSIGEWCGVRCFGVFAGVGRRTVAMGWGRAMATGAS